ncbi:hypothetical protein ACQ4OC_19215 [Yersinia sp. J1]|uniref:hypothetical protein n=1 Tax=Yersinia sp. J1 TaxID=3424774 RepID=UPI003D36660E
MRKYELRDLLYEVWKQTNNSEFSGIGIIVCDYADNLPITNLRDTYPDYSGSISGLLSNISNKKSKYHDGFHILNMKGDITHVAQYFSPPIIQGSNFDRSRLVGGRFVAALFGSSISGVLMTGIVSEGHRLSIFENGKEIHFEEFL